MQTNTSLLYWCVLLQQQAFIIRSNQQQVDVGSYVTEQLQHMPADRQILSDSSNS